MTFQRRTLKQVQSLFISAGHSDTDPGAYGNGYTEADIVLSLRDKLYQELDSRGIVLSTDGEKGDNLPLRQAVQMASSHEVAIELHCNAFSDPRATGTEVLCEEWNVPLGTRLSSRIADAIGVVDRGTKDESSGQHSRLAFVSTGHGLILELFFLSNRKDLDLFFLNRERVVKAICDVLEEEVCRDPY